jgi:hypothetical protein
MWLRPSSFAATCDAIVQPQAHIHTADIIDDIINILGGGNGAGTGGAKP